MEERRAEEQGQMNSSELFNLLFPEAPDISLQCEPAHCSHPTGLSIRRDYRIKINKIHKKRTLRGKDGLKKESQADEAAVQIT